MKELIQYEVLVFFGIVIFFLALPYIWEWLLKIKAFIEDINDDTEGRYGI